MHPTSKPPSQCLEGPGQGGTPPAAEESEDLAPAEAKGLPARSGNYAGPRSELSTHLGQGAAQGKRSSAPRPSKRASG